MKKLFVFLVIFASVTFAKERLVVLDPASIETIFMLGSGDEIVGIAHMQHTQIYPEHQTAKIASVGSFSNPSIEKIIALKPTLVIVSAYSMGLEPRLKELGIKSLYLSADRLEDIYKNVRQIAEILGKKSEGEALITQTKNELEVLKNEPLRKRGIFLFASNPLMAFPANSMIADIFTLIGIENLTPQSQIQRPIITAEFILKQNPDLLVLGITLRDTDTLIAQNPTLKSTAAYKQGNIFAYEKIHTLLRMSPQIPARIKKFKEFLRGNMR